MCSKGVKDITWWKMETFHRQLSSMLQYESGCDWVGRRDWLGRQPVTTSSLRTRVHGQKLESQHRVQRTWSSLTESKVNPFFYDM